MKIAFLSSFYPYCGKISEGNTALFRIFEKNNPIKAYNYSLLYPELLFPGAKQFYAPNDKCDIINSERILSTANPASYYSVAKTINIYNPDLYITRYWMPYLGVSLGKIAQKISKNTVKIAIIDSFHTIEEQYRASKNNEYFLINHDAFVVMNDEAKKYLISVKPNAHYIEHPLPIYSYIYSNIEKKKARKLLNLPENKHVMLFFGEIRDYKGVDIALQSCSQLNDEYVLIIAGESHNNFDYYQRMIDKLNIRNKISLHVRYIDENEVPIFFSAADVMLLPYKEKIPTDVINASFLYNLPVITTNFSNEKETVESNKMGLVINEAQSDLLAETIKNYFSNNLSELHLPNIITYKYNNSWENFAASIYNLYDRLSKRNDLNIY